MLSWDKLLNGTRRKSLHQQKEIGGTSAGRTQLERDYDRILFATPTRRLADKTQVFPMEVNDSVRNRLTHSHEVSNLARGIGTRLAFEHAEKVFGPHHDALNVKRDIPAILAAIGLAHDLGNPPFGHQGEIAMQQWFSEKAAAESESDFLQFDGNAQTFRLLTRLQVLNDEFGLNLCVATLAALLKYPSVYGSNQKGGYKKYGIFLSEKRIVEEVWEHTGLSEGIRHPLAYIMEACDDIAYSIIDAEDTVKKGYASFYDLMAHLESNGDGDETIKKIIETSWNYNETFKKDAKFSLSSRELNDVSMQMFRVNAIAEMVECAVAVFVDRSKSIMSGEVEPGFELMKASACGHLCKVVKDFDGKFGFQHKEVLKLELKGNNYIKSMMGMLWRSISSVNRDEKPFERYVFGSISENYRRIYQSSNKDGYAQRQLMCDAVSGMTESYLVNMLRHFKSVEYVD